MNDMIKPKKKKLIEDLAVYFLQEGMKNTGLRTLAKAVGTSDRMLLHYFNDKEDLISTVLTKISDDFMILLSKIEINQLSFTDFLPVLAASIKDPQIGVYSRIWLELAALSTKGDEPFLRISREIMHNFMNWLAPKIRPHDLMSQEKQLALMLSMMEGFVFLNALGQDTEIALAIEAMKTCFPQR